MNHRSHQNQKSRSWLWIFVAGLFVIFAGGSGLWFFAAHQFEQFIDQQKDRLSTRQQFARCENQEVRGFPFRFGVFCDRIEFSDQKQKLDIKSGALRTAAQFYAPGKVVAELDGPAIIDLGPTATTTVNWKSMRSSFTANLDGIRELSIAGTQVSVDSTLSNQDKVSMQQLELHSRKVGIDDLEAAVGVLNLDLGNHFGANIGPVTITLEFIALDLFGVSLKGGKLIEAVKERGASGKVNALKFEPESGGKLSVSGPMAISAQGLITSDLSIELENANQLLEYLKQALPDHDEAISRVGAILDTLGGTQPGKTLTVKLNIRDNNLSFGLIPLGSIPPLF